MRIHLYGVQGSGSVFPRSSEREAARKVTEHHLLERVFEDLKAQADAEGRLDCRIEDILGGKANHRTLLDYWKRIRPAPIASYGGWTTCVHVETADGLDLVFDCGSGFRNCSKDLQQKWADQPERVLHLFGSHSHRDHTEGFDQAPVCFDPRNTFRIYGNRQFLYALDEQLGIFSHKLRESVWGIHTPINYAKMPARFQCCPIRIGDDVVEGLMPDVSGPSYAAGAPIEIRDTVVTPFELFHPAPCLGYCVESGDAKFVFATDHELLNANGGDVEKEWLKMSRESEDRLTGFSMNADVLYRDGQFLQPEYLGEKGIGDSGPIPRIGWGHSCIEEIREMAAACEVKHTCIGHHDPNREWSEKQWIDESLARSVAGTGRTMELAKAETVIDL